MFKLYAMRWVAIVLVWGVVWAQQPFSVQLVPVNIPGMPGLQSFAWGKTKDGKWILIGGRRDGLHLRSPFDSFDPAFNNKDIFLVDVKNQQVWSVPLSSLPTSIQEQLQSTNMQFYQRDSILYIVGGYGYSASAADHITFPYLTAIHVDSLAYAIMNGLPIQPYFRQIQDSRMQVTGGQMGYLDSVFYLCGGQVFMGRYNPMGGPTFSQQYVEEIRKFKIVDTQDTLYITDYTTILDPANLHRRDYNMVPQIFPDGTKGFTMFTGVFQHNADLPFLNSVDVFPNGYQVVNHNLYLSHYHSAKIAVYDSIYNTMHTVFFGGIAQYYLDDNGNLVKNDSVPFVRTISRVTRFPNWQLQEYKIGEMPDLIGASAEFIPVSNDTLFIHGEIIHLNRIPSDTSVLVGYIVGGIRSTAPNIFWTNDGTQSSASSTIYAVYLSKDSSQAIPVHYQEPVRTIAIKIYPNPVRDKLQVELLLPPENTYTLQIVDASGKILLRKPLQNYVGPYKETLDLRFLRQGVYFLEIVGGSHKKSITFVKAE